jgi:hypothetical protein
VLEAGIAPPAVGVQDPEFGPPARRPEPAPADRGLGLLPDHVPAETDPGAAREHEAEHRGLGDRAGERSRIGGLEDDEEGTRSTGDRGEPSEPLDARPALPPVRQGTRSEVEHDDVDGACLEERSRDRDGLVERRRRQDREVVEVHATRDRLDRIERRADVDPGRERARTLRFGDEPERERRRAARAGTVEGDRRRERDATRAEDRIERGKSGRDDVAGWSVRPASGEADRHLARRIGRKRCDREGAVRFGLVRPQVAPEPAPRSCGTPPRPQGREGGGDIRCGQRHDARIEQMFDDAKRAPGDACYTSRPSRRGDGVGM